MDAAIMEKSMETPLKTRNKYTIWSSSRTTGHKPWENHDQKRHMKHNVHSFTILNIQKTKIMASGPITS